MTALLGPVTRGLPDVADLPRLTNQEVTIADPVRFGQSMIDDLALLRLLREATSHAVRLRWTLAGRPVVDPQTHVHLVAPDDGEDDDAREYARQWSTRYRYGSFYYRRGPGFVVIKDVRDGGEPARMTVAEGSEHFLAMTAAHRVSELAPDASDVLDTAVEAGLAVRSDDHLLVLPYRMRHWPVPYVAV